MKLEKLSENSGNWMATGKFEHQPCIYENADILVTHKIATFENGSREAILQSILKKDGLLWRGETEATPLLSKTSKSYLKLVIVFQHYLSQNFSSHVYTST